MAKIKAISRERMRGEKMWQETPILYCMLMNTPAGCSFVEEMRQSLSLNFKGIIAVKKVDRGGKI